MPDVIKEYQQPEDDPPPSPDDAASSAAASSADGSSYVEFSAFDDPRGGFPSREDPRDRDDDDNDGAVQNFAAVLLNNSPARESSSWNNSNNNNNKSFILEDQRGSVLTPVEEIDGIVTDSESSTAASGAGPNSGINGPADTPSASSRKSISSSGSSKIPGSVSVTSVGSKTTSTNILPSPLKWNEMDTSADTDVLSAHNTSGSLGEDKVKKSNSGGSKGSKDDDDDSAIALLKNAVVGATQNSVEVKINYAPFSSDHTHGNAATTSAISAQEQFAPQSPSTPNISEEDTSKFFARFDRKPPVLTFGQFEINDSVPLHYSDTEILLSAYDHWSKPPQPVMLKWLTHASKATAELLGRDGLDESYIVPVKRIFVDRVFPDLTYDGPITVEGRLDGLTEVFRACLGDRIARAPGLDQDIAAYPTCPYMLCLEQYDRTLEDVLTHDHIDLPFIRTILKDVVVGLILVHTETRIHGDIKPRSIVKSGNNWKLSDFQSSCKMGTERRASLCNHGYCPPEVAAVMLEERNGVEDAGNYIADSAYDLWSLGVIIYELMLGSSLWNVDRTGTISPADLESLAKWSPHTFVKKAYDRFPPAERTDDQKAAIDLISKLLAPTPADRLSNFQFGIVSVHQHEFLAAKPLERSSLDNFKAKQDAMLEAERKHSKYGSIIRELSLEEQWEFRRARDVLLLGLFESTEKYTPTSFVILKQKLPPYPRDQEQSERAAKERLDEGMRWVCSFEDLGPCVKGALDGDVRAIGQFWGKINGMFNGDYMYMYFVDELTGEPVRVVQSDDDDDDNNNNNNDNDDNSIKLKGQYPIEITTRSDLVPKMLPLMQLTMRSMALYHGVAGIARMFGSTQLTPIPEDIRRSAQAKINDLKSERSSSPFGLLEDDVKQIHTNKEQFLKKNSIRGRSLAELVSFLTKKFEGDNSGFAGLNRYPDQIGRAVWTTLKTPEEIKIAMKRRSEERIREEMNLWVDHHQQEVEDLRENLGEEQEKVIELTRSLRDTKEELDKSIETVKTLDSKAIGLEKSLDTATHDLSRMEQELEAERKKASCCVVQ